DGGAMLIVNADDENEAREKLENDPWMEAWRSQAGECPPLANLHRCQEVVTLTALVTREIRFQFAREPIARERDVMQFARSTLRFFGLTALGVVFVCLTRADERPMMRAVVTHEYGAPEVLKIEQVQRPEPNDDEALVRVIAGSVNPADPLTLSGKYAKEFGT